VIHLAGLVSFSVKDKDLLQNVNVQGTKNILKALQENNIENFIHISSVAALGYNNDENKPVNEQFEFDWNIAVKRKKYYMLTKHLADLEVQKQIRKGLNAIICYPGLMLGPGDRTNSPKLINAIKKGKIPFNMPGGTNIIDVRDVSRGIVTALEKNITNGDYLLSGDNLTFKNVNETIAKILSAKAPKLTLPGFLNNFLFRILLFVESMAKNKLSLTADNLDSAFKFRYFDNTKAREQLLWQPKINFEKTIKDTIEWMNQNDFF
jgi:nucleoside-diphosphate-sugar epimerase